MRQFNARKSVPVKARRTKASPRTPPPPVRDDFSLRDVLSPYWSMRMMRSGDPT